MVSCYLFYTRKSTELTKPKHSAYLSESALNKITAFYKVFLTEELPQNRRRFFKKNPHFPIDNFVLRCYYIQAFKIRARVVELADSLDSGSSAHSGRAGSSPASRTKKKRTSKRMSVFFLVRGVIPLNPILGLPNSLHRLFGKKAKSS